MTRTRVRKDRWFRREYIEPIRTHAEGKINASGCFPNPGPPISCGLRVEEGVKLKGSGLWREDKLASMWQSGEKRFELRAKFRSAGVIARGCWRVRGWGWSGQVNTSGRRESGSGKSVDAGRGVTEGEENQRECGWGKNVRVGKWMLRRRNRRTGETVVMEKVWK